MALSSPTIATTQEEEGKKAHTHTKKNEKKNQQKIIENMCERERQNMEIYFFHYVLLVIE